MLPLDLLTGRGSKHRRASRGIYINTNCPNWAPECNNCWYRLLLLGLLPLKVRLSYTSVVSPEMLRLYGTVLRFIAAACSLLSFVLVVGANHNLLKFALAHAFQRVRSMVLSHQTAFARVPSTAQLWQCKHSFASLGHVYVPLGTLALKPGCLMTHKWLHTPECKSLIGK